MTPPDNSFFGLGIAPGILEILQKAGFTVPTPIQQQSILVTLEGEDMTFMGRPQASLLL